MSPSDCNCTADILALETSHKSVGDFDIMIQHDQALVLTEQPNGGKYRAQIVIPKRAFNQFIAWYEKNQERKP